MANLETLELTINANAESASVGLSKLISSLTSLSTKVQKTTTSLTLLNKELSTLKGYGKVKIPSFTGNKTSGSSSITTIKAETKAITEQANAAQKLAIAVQNSWAKNRGLYNWNNGQKSKLFNPLTGKFDRDADFSRKEPSSTLPKAADVIKNINKQADESPSKFEKLKTGFKNLGKELKGVLPKFTALHRVMRIASTMLIRMGVRALFKGIKEGLGNYYEYSKGINGAFATAADNLSSVWATLKNQMGAAIAPAITAAIPIINSLASAATTAFNALSQLFALLTGQGSWSKATAQVNAFDSAAKKAGGGGGGLNEMLAKFDELNVIASESGGGGGAGAAAEEYSTMFEEMYEFDSKIRDLANFIKDTISWVTDNFDVVLTTVGLIGAAILGWKISKAFEGSLSTLGKLIEGGALIAIGVVLSFDFGKKAGSAMLGGDSLNAGDILEAVAGVVASAIGGYVIAGAVGLSGGVGAAVGVGIAIVATIAGIFVGAVDQNDKNKWGNVKLSSEEIQNYVRKQFKFDVTAEIKILDTKIANARTARAHLNAEIQEFSSSLDKIQLNGVDTEKSIEKAKEGLNTVIESLKTYLSETGSLLDTLFKINPTDMADQVKKDVETADKQITKYVENEGKKIADLYDQGMKNGWKGNEQEQIYALLTHLESIFEAAEADQAYNRFMGESKLKIKDMTRETAEEILKAQKAALDSYEKSLSDATQEAYESLLYRAKLAEEAGLPEVAAGLRRDAQYLIDAFKDKTKEKLDSAKETMKKDWISQLKEVYASDYANAFSSNISASFYEMLKAKLKEDEGEAKRYVQQEMENVLSVNKITKEAAELFGITGWDLLADSQKRTFVKNMQVALGNDAVRILKESLNISASELISVSGWANWQTKQRLEFITALTNAYGSSQALTAAKNAGIKVADEIRAGLNSKDSATKTSAQNLVNMIQQELDKKGIKINASVDVAVAVQALIEYQTKQVASSSAGTAAKTSILSTASKISPSIVRAFADGQYGIDSGEVFIAQEHGAELVGSINGKTSVANQQQIIEGIASGVERANSEQNTLLRQQNELLRGILEKDNSVRLNASAALGRVARQSLDMYGSMVGG